MKIYKIKYLLLAIFTIMVSSCEPIVDEEELMNNTTIDGVELVATQTTAGGNEIILSMNTPGVTGYWDYVLGKGYSDRITITLPVTGTFDIKYVGTLGAEFFEKTISVTIDVLDHPVAPEWAALLGDDAIAGKTWVFDGAAGDNGLWWYMSSQTDWDTVWWNAGGECCPPGDVNGKMHFDLNGGANYTYYADASSGENEMGDFVLDTENMKFQINGTNILGAAYDWEGGYNPDGRFDIISITEDEMILYIPDAQWTSGWTWIFRPE